MNNKWLGLDVGDYIENMIELDRRDIHALAGLNSPFKQIREEHKESVKRYTALLEIYKKTGENVLQSLSDSSPSWDEWVAEGGNLKAWMKLKESDKN